jgi:hypothetical protein
MASGHILLNDIPVWYGQIIIPIGFGLLMVHFTIRAFLRAHGLKRKVGEI